MSYGLRVSRALGVVVCLCLLGVPALAGDDKEEAAYRKIENKLESVVLDKVNWDEADITDVVAELAREGGITIVVDKKALKELSEEDREVTLELIDIKLGNALNLALEEVGLVKCYKHGLLYVTSEERAEPKLLTKIYDVRDITVKIVDFPTPEIRLKAEGDDGGPNVEIPEEPDDPTVEDIVDLIEETIEADWGGKCSVREVKGNLIVKAPRNVQKEVASLLAQLRSSK